jgi:hypothetical protein
MMLNLTLDFAANAHGNSRFRNNPLGPNALFVL